MLSIIAKLNVLCMFFYCDQILYTGYKLFTWLQIIYMGYKLFTSPVTNISFYNRTKSEQILSVYIESEMC